VIQSERISPQFSPGEAIDRLSGIYYIISVQDRSLMKRGLFISLTLTLVWVSVGLSDGTDLRVITDNADIFAEPNSKSYLI
jgi:hypothetical protein